MTSVTSANNAALLILQQVNSSSATSNVSDTKSAADQITAIVNRVSGEDSLAKTKSSATINSGLLDIQETKDSVVSKALDFLDSDSFRSSDPSIKDTLKKLIGDDGSKFALMVKVEKANKPGISDDNAIANAIQGFIRDNRSQFGDDEFVLGFKLANGGAIIANIEDINGNSTSKTLSEIKSANLKEWSSSLAAFLEEAKDPTTTKSSVGGEAMLALDAVMSSVNEQAAWTEKWRAAFNF